MTKLTLMPEPVMPRTKSDKNGAKKASPNIKWIKANKHKYAGNRGWLDRIIVGINDYDGKRYLNRYDSAAARSGL